MPRDWAVPGACAVPSACTVPGKCALPGARAMPGNQAVPGRYAMLGACTMPCPKLCQVPAPYHELTPCWVPGLCWVPMQCQGTRMCRGDVPCWVPVPCHPPDCAKCLCHAMSSHHAGCPGCAREMCHARHPGCAMLGTRAVLGTWTVPGNVPCRVRGLCCLPAPHQLPELCQVLMLCHVPGTQTILPTPCHATCPHRARRRLTWSSRWYLRILWTGLSR